MQQLAEQARTGAVVRRNSRGGAGAAEHLIAALRCLYNYAVADGLLTTAGNPAAQVYKPRRQDSTRQALAHEPLAQLIDVAVNTGNDPDLDRLILRLHLETACRRGGALALRRRDLESQQCLVWLREKGQTSRWQPVSPTLAASLLLHLNSRADTSTDLDSPLLRYRHGRPITGRRYDYLFKRVGQYLPWVATRGVSIHWIRHTTLTWVERNYGQAVARKYAGHGLAPRAQATATYVKATLEEVADALSAFTGEPHPLAGQGQPYDIRLPLP